MRGNQFEKQRKTQMEVISTDEYSILMQLTEKNGDFLVRVYQVFPGITITFSDAHIQTVCLEERKTKPNDMFEISYCKEGCLECNIHDEVCHLDSGDFVIAQTNAISPMLYFPLGHYHGLTIHIELNKIMKNSLLLFGKEVVDVKKITEKFSSEKGGVVAHADCFLERIFSDLYQLPVKNQKGYFYIKILELLLFLSEANIIENEFEKRCYTKAQADLAKRIREYMLAHMNVHITLKELEKHFHMSGSHLKKTFKRVYGVTIADYTRVQKMESAAYMLEHTDKSILEIANAHGYYNGSKFANVFRAVKGCNPNEYRKQI